MMTRSLSRPPFLSTLLAAAIAAGSLCAAAPDADARGFGSAKWRQAAKVSSKKQRPARRGFFTKRKAKPAKTISASSTVYLQPTQPRPRRQTQRQIRRLAQQQARQQARRGAQPVETAVEAEVLSHPTRAPRARSVKAPRKRSLLARLFSPQPKTTAPRAAKLAPGQPNAAQPAPKIDHVLIAASSRSQSRVVINIAQQRAYVYLNGKLAVDTPVSTARQGKSTPRGSFRVGERVAQGKISTIYKVTMPYWMRLGSSPYGMHAGYLPGYPASAGCIRLPYAAAEAIYKATGYGTRVKIVSG